MLILKRDPKFDGWIDAELFAEGFEGDFPFLHLQDEFTDKSLVRGGSVGATERESAFIQRFLIIKNLIEILVMGSLKVAKRSNAGPEEIGTAPDVVAIDEAISLLVANEFVAAGDLITDGETAIKGFIDPTAFSFPVGDGGLDSVLTDFFGDQGIEGEFHLVDGDVIGGEFENFINAGGPVFIGFADHAGDEVDIDLGEADFPDPVPGAEDLGREMGTTVFFEDLVVEIFNAKREAGDPDIAEGFELIEAESARFAFKGNFASVIP